MAEKMPITLLLLARDGSALRRAGFLNPHIFPLITCIQRLAETFSGEQKNDYREGISEIIER